MGNRVEDLERRVADLQAAVDGLTEELVETKERLRQLEAAADESDAGAATPEADGGSEVASDVESDEHAEFVANPTREGDPGENGTTADAKDVTDGDADDAVFVDADADAAEAPTPSTSASESEGSEPTEETDTSADERKATEPNETTETAEPTEEDDAEDDGDIIVA